MFKFGKHIISRKGKPFFIAECGSNHQGKISIAYKLIDAAIEAGASCVKFQKKCVTELYTKEYLDRPYDNPNSFGETYGKHKHYLELDIESHAELKAYAEERGVEYLCTPFDFTSVDQLAAIGVKAYKIASADCNNIPLIRRVCEKNRPIFLSTGASLEHEVRRAYNEITYNSNCSLVLLHCVSSYPCDYKNLRMENLEWMMGEFDGATIGYSGHDVGVLAPTIAYMLGARVFEKHFTLNRAWKGTDHSFSLEPQGFKRMVRDIGRIEEMMQGKNEKVIQYCEEKAREKMGKSLYAAQTLPAGYTLQETDIVVKVPAGGFVPILYYDLIGQRLKLPILMDQPFTKEHVDGLGNT